MRSFRRCISTGAVAVTLGVTAALALSVAPPLSPFLAPAAAYSGTLCSGYAGCKAEGKGSAGYASHNHKMYWSMYSGHNCTNYVAYRMVRKGMPNRRPWKSYGSGNAENWGNYLRSRTNMTPRVGSVAWYRAYSSRGGSSGHVAYVEKVLSPSKVVISQDSWGGTFSWEVISKGNGWPSGFIHLRDTPLKNRERPEVSGSRRVRRDPLGHSRALGPPRQGQLPVEGRRQARRRRPHPAADPPHDRQAGPGRGRGQPARLPADHRPLGVAPARCCPAASRPSASPTSPAVRRSTARSRSPPAPGPRSRSTSPTGGTSAATGSRGLRLPPTAAASGHGTRARRRRGDGQAAWLRDPDHHRADQARGPPGADVAAREAPPEGDAPVREDPAPAGRRHQARLRAQRCAGCATASSSREPTGRRYRLRTRRPRPPDQRPRHLPQAGLLHPAPRHREDRLWSRPAAGASKVDDAKRGIKLRVRRLRRRARPAHQRRVQQDGKVLARKAMRGGEATLRVRGLPRGRSKIRVIVLPTDRSERYELVRRVRN